MRLTRLASFLVRRAWHRFAQRSRLRDLPPVPTILAILALGTAVPLITTGTARPTALSPRLAAKRLVRFAERYARTLPESGPQGPVFSRRPVLFWPAQPGAARYAVALRQGGTVVVEDRSVRRCYLRLRPPGTLAPGRAYRFEVRALDAAGRAIGVPLAHDFSVRPPPASLGALRDQARGELGAAGAALVLAGHFAEQRSVHDVVSALVRWKVARGEEADLARGAPADWVAAEAGRLRQDAHGLREGPYNALSPLR